LGAGPEVAAALESGKIAAAALNIRYAIPFLQRNWPMLIDLTKTDLVYPSSCVTTSRAFVKSEPKTVDDFLRAYVEAIPTDQKGSGLCRTLAGEMDEGKRCGGRDPVDRIPQADSEIAAYVPDKGIENVVNDLASRRKVPQEFIGRPELFRDSGPLERAVAR